MSLPLGQQLRIRGMIYVAGEPVPYFWPMRSFIHHNPLHGFENLPFPDAVARGERLFHARGFLSRRQYQRYLAQGKVDRDALSAGIARFAATRPGVAGVDLQRWLQALLTEEELPVASTTTLAGAGDVSAALQNVTPSAEGSIEKQALEQQLRAHLLGERPVYEAVDALYGTEIGSSLDELVVKSCLDFFDEGQSAWSMPQREKGFFAAWREVARSNVRFLLRRLHIGQILDADDTPEGVIAYVMESLKVPERDWVGYFTREIARLHGWTGFIRWRAHAKNYYWSKRYPADLVDYLAVRLTLALALLRERGRKHIANTAEEIAQAIEQRTAETYLRHELYGGKVMPAMAHRIDTALADGSERALNEAFFAYIGQKRRHEAVTQANHVRRLAERAGESAALTSLPHQELERLIETLRDFERQEGMIWVRAMEARAMNRLLDGVSLLPPPQREKRPFAQALFCIDTRSERIRRHLEAIGDYQTFGLAGFFGVPVSFMELGKGSETHLCPVLLTPKNVVLEMSAVSHTDDAAVAALEKAMDELKESVITPFVTVEAIGLFFGLDMVGKTVAPHFYHRWRKRMRPGKPPTRLLLDKLSREQADSIVRAVQRAVIVKAVEQELGLVSERITDDLIRALREAALGNAEVPPDVAATLGKDEPAITAFIERLRGPYHINESFAHQQMERLGRIGFTIDEQVLFVAQALRAIGLTSGFSRFVLLAGHGSTSENNPYESALDCGACGGNHGLVSARVLAQMANNPEVRRRLREKKIDIADDAWFIPALHNTTTDELNLFDLEMLPSSHMVYLDRLRNGLSGASRRCVQERLPTLQMHDHVKEDPVAAYRSAARNAVDWSQVRPEWGLSGNAYFIIGQRELTRQFSLEGRAFLHSYDYRIDRKRRLLENILTGPLVVAQWINMEHYFSTVDHERFGSGSKVYHNVAGRFAVMTGNLSDLRTGLPSQTVLDNGVPYHQPLRLITVIEAPFDHARRAIEDVASVKTLVRNSWIRLVVIDPDAATICVYEDGEWHQRPYVAAAGPAQLQESSAS